MIRAVAIFALIIGLAAAGYQAYLLTIVKKRYDTAMSNCANSKAIQETIAANWRSVEANVDLLKAKRKFREAEKFAQEHASERPPNFELPVPDCDVPAPDYVPSSVVAVVGLIASVVIFGAAKPRRRRG